MTQFQLSACAEMLWRDRPIAWRCARLHEMGFGVGLWDWAHLDLDKLAATGARFSIMNGFQRGGLTGLDAGEQMIASAREAVMVGQRLGVERLNLLGGALGPGGGALQPVIPTGAMWLCARDILAQLADLAEQEGVTFALENLNTAVDHPGVPFARAEETLALVAAVNHPHLQLNLDLYHAQIGEGNLTALCQKALHWIGEIQVADVPGRCEPGTGEVNWPSIARSLKSMGYAGPVTFEGHASGREEDALEAFRAAFSV